MQRASLAGVLAVTIAMVALAGCTQSPPPTTDNGGGTSGTGADVGANVTAGNTSANTTAGGNVTYGNTTGNATEGNATTGNATTNATVAQNATLYDQDASYSATPPADATFDVKAAYAHLEVNVTNNGLLLVGVKVTLKDPGGNSTVVYDGSGNGKITDIAAPASGSWTLHFDGNGSGAIHVTVKGTS